MEIRNSINIKLSEGQCVEFTSSAWCKVLGPSWVRNQNKTFLIKKGEEGEIVDMTDWETLPGDYPVMIIHNDNVFVVAVREGLLAPFLIEFDHYTGLKKFKHYRAMTVAIASESDDVI
jgi:hypothetical protein